MEAFQEEFPDIANNPLLISRDRSYSGTLAKFYIKVS